MMKRQTGEFTVHTIYINTQSQHSGTAQGARLYHAWISTKRKRECEKYKIKPEREKRKRTQILLILRTTFFPFVLLGLSQKKWNRMLRFIFPPANANQIKYRQAAAAAAAVCCERLRAHLILTQCAPKVQMLHCQWQSHRDTEMITRARAHNVCVCVFFSSRQHFFGSHLTVYHTKFAKQYSPREREGEEGGR